MQTLNFIVLDYDPFGMITQGRNWTSGSGEEYRFGFNGKENTDEIYGDDNAVDFGVRLYDPRLGKWLSIDPIYKNFPSSSPYVYCANNPIRYIDQQGKEPSLLMTGTIEDAMKYFNSKGLTNVDDILDEIDNTTIEIFREAKNPKGMIRYIYTEDNGWIDLYHYFSAAQKGEKYMDAAEFVQEFFEKGSGYSYEDLPSNKMGGEAPLTKVKEVVEFDENFVPIKTYEEVELVGKELFDAVISDFNSAGATEPTSAPNYNKIPRVRSREPLPDFLSTEERKQLLRTGKYVPQNFTDEPYDLTNFNPARDSIDGEKIKAWKHAEDPF